MKKLFLFVSIFAISLVSCSDDDDNSTPVNEANIMKKWYLKSYEVAGQTIPYLNEPCGRDYMEFLSGGVYKEYYIYGCDPIDADTDTGTWALSGNSLTVNILGDTETATVSSLTSTTMQFTKLADYDEDPSTPEITIKINLTSN